jgi:uncharacterized protein
MMSLSTLENAVKKAFEFAGSNQVNFAFQGGEPTLSGLTFYRSFIELVKRYNISGAPVTYALQTNGILLDKVWFKFLKENNFLVGLSIDGDEGMNAYRVDKGGINAFEQILDTLDGLKAYGVEFNTLTVVTKLNYKHLNRTYSFLRSRGVKYMQFISCLKGIKGGVSPYALDMPEYEEFLVRLFGLYFNDYMSGNYISIRNFDNYVQVARGGEAEMCGLRGYCGIQFVIEGDGTVFPCDFYCLDEYKLGNINESSYRELAETQAARQFLKESLVIEDKCRSCEFYRLCKGGCKRYNIDNDYCAAYKGFFRRSAKLFRMM